MVSQQQLPPEVVVVDCRVVEVVGGLVVEVVGGLVVEVVGGRVVVVGGLVVVVGGLVVVVDKGIQSEGELHTAPAFEQPEEQCSILVPLQVQEEENWINQFQKLFNPPTLTCA